MAYEIVIRNGTVIDGSGRPGFRADVGISAGKIRFIGVIREEGSSCTLDADGRVVTPGFIDGHTHYDAQLTWDTSGSSSCWHGVTTAVMGNCGFTIAPCRRGNESLLLSNLERVEDIPAAALAGIDFRWETFAEYLDVLDTLPLGINYVTQVGHSALRAYAMGDKAMESEADEDELRTMTGELESALRAGAIGLTSSRGVNDVMVDGRPVASRLASWEEIRALVGHMGELRTGMFELAMEPDISSSEPEVQGRAAQRYIDLAVDTGVPISFGTIAAHRYGWKQRLKLVDDAVAAGGRMFAQTTAREVNILLSFETILPFDQVPAWAEFRARPLSEQKVLLGNPDVRAALVRSATEHEYTPSVGADAQPPIYDNIKVFRTPMPPYETIGEIAHKSGSNPVEIMIDLSLEKDLKQIFLQTVALHHEEDILATMEHPRAVMTFSDSGAHLRQIIESSLYTYLLGYWVRKKQAFTLEHAVRMITYVPASLWGFADRGLLQEGMVADINVFDPETIGPAMPQVVYDLPGGCARLEQRAFGIDATIVNGVVTIKDGKQTGDLPGRLIRGGLASTAR